MKTKFSLLFSALGLASLSAIGAYAATPIPELVTVSPEHLFAPMGFDNNDITQLTIAGQMRNTCFKAGPPEVRVDQEAKKIYVHDQAYYYSSGWCLQMIVPYVKTIDLGILAAGSYEIRVKKENGRYVKKGALSVAVSKNSGPDDHLYALIEEAQIDPPQEGSPKTLTLSGLLTGDCMELAEIQVLYREPNVIEVLPIVTIEQEAGCDTAPRRFQREVKLSPAWRGSTLVHIRSLNGQALNKVTQF